MVSKNTITYIHVRIHTYIYKCILTFASMYICINIISLKGPIKYGSIYGEAKEFSITNPLSSLRLVGYIYYVCICKLIIDFIITTTCMYVFVKNRQKLRSNGSISSSQLSSYCTKRNTAYIIIAIFCLFSFLGIMELTSPNYMQSFVNPSGEVKVDGSGIEAAPAGDHMHMYIYVHIYKNICMHVLFHSNVLPPSRKYEEYIRWGSPSTHKGGYTSRR